MKDDLELRTDVGIFKGDEFWDISGKLYALMFSELTYPVLNKEYYILHNGYRLISFVEK